MSMGCAVSTEVLDTDCPLTFARDQWVAYRGPEDIFPGCAAGGPVSEFAEFNLIAEIQG
jgi:hypothetical protein